MPPPLDYSPQPRRPSPLRITPRRLVALFLVASFASFLAFWLVRGDLRTSAQIRLDSGDLRYCYAGIPLIYQRMPEPQRSQLLGLAPGSAVLKPEWHTCATFPLRGSNNPDAMCRGWYDKATVWAAEDPQLARVMLEDVAGYVVVTNAAQGLPESCIFLSGFYVEPDDKGRWALRDGWREDQELLAYARSKGVAPTTSPVESALR